MDFNKPEVIIYTHKTPLNLIVESGIIILCKIILETIKPCVGLFKWV